MPGRPSGYSFNGNVTVATTLGYNGAGQVSSVQGTLSPASVSFNLIYTTGTDWVGSITSGSFFSRTQTLLPNTNVLDRVFTQWNGVTKGDFDATFNTATEPRGWRTEESRSGQVVALGAHYQTFRYDERGEINESHNSVQWTHNFNWDYDLAGNRTWFNDWGVGTTSYTPAGDNHYTAISGVLAESPLTHDTDGNLTQDGTWTYTYDGENRLKSMSKSGQTLTFTYDYAGRRIRKQVSGAGADDRKYVWQGWKLAAETTGDGYSIYYAFIWGPDFSNAQGSAGGAGGLLAIYSPGWVLHFAVSDSMGNVVGYLDANGNVDSQAEYSVFGRAIATAGQATTLPIGFAGQYTDWQTGLIYYGLRYYNPKHGRFLNRDPIEEAGGNNLYGFVGNNPVNRWDVLGLCYFDDGIFRGCDGLTGTGEINFVFGGDIITSTGLWDPMIWIYMLPTRNRWRPFTTGTFTQPNISFNDGWQRDWRLRDAIYRAQGFGQTTLGFVEAGGGAAAAAALGVDVTILAAEAAANPGTWTGIGALYTIGIPAGYILGEHIIGPAVAKAIYGDGVIDDGVDWEGVDIWINSAGSQEEWDRRHAKAEKCTKLHRLYDAAKGRAGFIRSKKKISKMECWELQDLLKILRVEQDTRRNYQRNDCDEVPWNPGSRADHPGQLREHGNEIGNVLLAMKKKGCLQ